MMGRYRLALLILLLVLVPDIALAAGPETPIPPLPPPTWEEIPDVSGYLSFAVPQCGDCNGLTAVMEPYEEADFPSLSWDLRAVFGGLIRWLLAGIGNWFRWLICWLLQIVQYIANFLALMLNSLVALGNFIVRVLVHGWLGARSKFYYAVFLFEHIRNVGWWVSYGALNVYEVLKVALQGVLQVLSLLGTILMLLLDIATTILRLLAWIAGVTFTPIGNIFTALGGSNIPDKLNNTNTIASIVRGMLDGLFDSQIGWLLWVNIGMAYIAWARWIVGFLSSKGSEG